MNPTSHGGSCLCCGRPRKYAAKSLAKKSSTKALLLHADLSRHTRPEQVADMVAHGFDVNELSSEGYTVLHCAALNGQAGVVRELLRFGADTEIPAVGGRRAMHYAVESGSLATVQELASRGAALSPPSDADGLTPLHEAGHKGHEKIVELLLQAGADLGAVTSHVGLVLGHSLYRIGRCAKQHYISLVRLRHRSFSPRPAEAGHLECVRVMLHFDVRGDVVAAVDASGASALQVAQFAQRPAVVELLLLHYSSESAVHDRMLQGLLTTGAGRPR
ncbi:hypothetical protein ACHHYP_09000 [Achlya hypogyna]|uniref:Uncharacterized protein n=1 Tax=Achlya hypogyna TaxID=1202772 RepID=A0A1V9ZJS7_ACHHY|nr:hypothetical protein ACHHYP_09000 [Achlya hypogyna]